MRVRGSGEKRYMESSEIKNRTPDHSDKPERLHFQLHQI
jgi:hypothetical protein